MSWGIVNTDIASDGYFRSEIGVYCASMMTQRDRQQSFGERLRRFRESRGLTQNRLGMLSGVSPSNLALIEDGGRGVPQIATVAALADALNLTVEERTALFEAAVWEWMTHELAKIAAYYYLLVGGDEVLRDVVARFDAMTDSSLASGFDGLSAEELRKLYRQFAENARFEPVRDRLLASLISRLEMDLETGDLEITYRDSPPWRLLARAD